MTTINQLEPAPQANPDQLTVADYVLADIQERIAIGEAKYGTKLKTNNGRDALIGLYQELLDAVMYTRQLILERERREIIGAELIRRSLDVD